ncbi:hypothetical protein HDU93_005053 [Gonapodya sp. JEL0774]|nr:hypothetical protein HDU93_005053 [Gonapodya sp. JEL0774]
MSEPCRYDPSYDWISQPDLRKPPRVYTKDEIQELRDKNHLENPYHTCPLGYSGPPTSTSANGEKSFLGLTYHAPPTNHPGYPNGLFVSHPEQTPFETANSCSSNNAPAFSDTNITATTSMMEVNGPDSIMNDDDSGSEEEHELVADFFKESQMFRQIEDLNKEACADDTEVAGDAPVVSMRLPDFTTLTAEEVEKFRQRYNFLVFERVNAVLSSLENNLLPWELEAFKARFSALQNWLEKRCPPATEEDARSIVRLERENDAKFIKMAQQEFPQNRGIVSISPGIPISHTLYRLSYCPNYAAAFGSDTGIGQGIPEPIMEVDSCHAPTWSAAAENVLQPVWPGLMHGPNLIVQGEINLGYNSVAPRSPPVSITDVAKYSDLEERFMSRYGTHKRNSIPSQAAVNWSFKTFNQLMSESPVYGFYFEQIVCGRWG